VTKADNKTLGTPFPDALSQHVRGPQSEFTPSWSGFGRRVRVDEVTDVDGVSASSNLSAFKTTPIDHEDTHYSQGIRATPVRINHSTPRDDYIKTIPDQHIRDYSAISNLVQCSTLASTSKDSSCSQDLWTDKRRPQRADHVLGNERHALYLRNWLSALELQLESSPASPQRPQPKPKFTATTIVNYESKNVKLTTKKQGDDNKGLKRPRPRVVRTVEKMRGRKKQRVDSEEEDWIVDTDEEEDKYAYLKEESEEDDEDDVEFCKKQTLSRLRRIESSPPPLPSSPPPQINRPPLLTSDLHNTLLLTGPAGSGKTAAVYACAKELDWEVFEVYPGIGKRSGASLDQLVGEVGKNHLVRRAGGLRKKDGEIKNAFVEMFGRKTGQEKDVGADAAEHGAEGGPLEDEERVDDSEVPNASDFGFVVSKATGTDANEASGPIQGVRQSLILLEEVDILFEEDRGFWSAVINIIKDCRRPIIMTCNGELSLRYRFW
jgi:hypothetical protein